jgi:hypothetical protein
LSAEPSRRELHPETSVAPFLPQPASSDETGIDFGQLIDLCVKHIYFAGRPSAWTLSERMALPFMVTDQILTFLKREQFVEVVGTQGIGEQQYQYALSQKGNDKATEALERNQYVGPTPVPFEVYTQTVLAQSVRHIRVNPESVARGLNGLVLGQTTRSLIGPAVNSGRSMLLYGDPGNGKSSIAKAIGQMLPGQVYIPYAIDVSGHTIRVFDPRVHTQVETPAPEVERRRDPYGKANGERRRDQRWAICERPLIMAGGELTLADLELKFSPQARFYIAPLQVKANGGVLVIDDFGRQLVQPKELLNRWIVPMEARVDHLSLLSGETIEVPFELLLVFSTNIPPGQLGDEAFFRRIRHKIEVGDPTEEAFLAILRMVCEKNGIPFLLEGGEYLVERYYRGASRHFRGVHPRDILDLIVDISGYLGKQPSLTPEWIDLACASYFIET